MATEDVGLRLTLQGRREAAAGLTEVRGELQGVADAGHDVEDAGRAAARGLERASDRRFARGFSVIGRGVLGVTRGLGRGLLTATRGAAYGLGVVGVAAAATGVKAIGLAGDARETASAFDTVLGPSARGVQRDLDKLTNRFGIYSPQLQGAATGFATLGKQAGKTRKDLSAFSTDLVRAGLDLGSFYNATPEDAFAALQSGLTGEAEPLKRFNIFMSDAALNAFALKRGLGETTQEMTEQEKIALRHAFILANLGAAQGDLERTSKGFANQQRSASGRTREFLTMLGGPLTTAATGAFRGFNAIAKSGIRELEKRLPGLERRAGGLSRTFARWGRQMARDLPGAIATVSGGWDTLNQKIDHFAGSGGSAELGTLADNLKELGPAFGELAKELPGIHDLLTVTNEVTGFLADHTDLLAKAMPYLIGGYIALKASQLAANVVLAASLPMKVAELLTNRQLVKSNQALIASRAGTTAATVTETGATTANTVAQNGGILARAKAVVGLVAHRVAMGATAAATGVVTAAQWALNAAMTANPIGLIVAAIALLVGGLVVAYKKSETFRNIVNGAFTAVKRVAMGVFGWVKQNWPLLLAVLTGPFGLAVTVIAKNWDRIKAGVSTVREWVEDRFNGLVGFFKGMPGRIGRAASGMFDGIREAFRSAVNFIIDAWNGLSFGIPGFDPPGPGSFPGITVSTPNIPRLETGGPVTAGRPYIVGEKRPELFVPKVDGLILPRVPDPGSTDFDADLPALDGGGDTIVQLVLPDGRVLAETVVDGLKSKAARK